MASSDKNADHNLEKLIDTLYKLPPDDLKEVKRRLEKQLEASNRSRGPVDDLHEDDLWGLDLSRETADDAASMREVLRITSKFKGSIAKIVSEERDER
ncbi:MAG: hypothetical protein OXC45_05125 [Gemmatimonadetes bacterium]|nr:hypothetical protein [Gemmatimonadota bacterium]